MASQLAADQVQGTQGRNDGNRLMSIAGHLYMYWYIAGVGTTREGQFLED